MYTLMLKITDDMLADQEVHPADIQYTHSYLLAICLSVFIQLKESVVDSMHKQIHTHTHTHTERETHTLSGSAQIITMLSS